MAVGATIKAEYHRTCVSRFDGNPFIEAMPKLESSKLEFLTALSHSPPKPSATTRRASEVVRIMESSVIGDIVIPFPEYQKAGIALATIMREAYVSRNPLTALDRQRRHALVAEEKDGLPFPADWRSTAKGHFMMAVSGMGKTTFMLAFLLRYPQVICHTGYEGQHLQCHQILYIVLRVPHDATLRSLCIQFFEAVDRLLGTKYEMQSRAVRQIAPMVQLMNQVATAVSLGFLVVDEVQNLRSARSGHAENMLNLFSEIIERLGISLLLLGTPAVQSVLEGSVRNARKMTSYGETVLRPMKKNDPQWEIFCDTYWDYTFVKKKGRLVKGTRDAWHDTCGGNTAFASLAFLLAQRNEIGGREIVDAVAFERAAAMDMAFLQPAIAALRSGDPFKLRAFDDLMFSPKYEALRRLLGTKAPEAPDHRHEEFDDDEEVNTDNKTPTPKKPETVSPRHKSVPDLPMEDPLAK